MGGKTWKLGLKQVATVKLPPLKDHVSVCPSLAQMQEQCFQWQFEPYQPVTGTKFSRQAGQPTDTLADRPPWQTIGCISRDDSNGNDDARKQWSDWLNDEVFCPSFPRRVEWSKRDSGSMLPSGDTTPKPVQRARQNWRARYRWNRVQRARQKWRAR